MNSRFWVLFSSDSKDSTIPSLFEPTTTSEVNISVSRAWVWCWAICLAICFKLGFFLDWVPLVGPCTKGVVSDLHLRSNFCLSGLVTSWALAFDVCVWSTIEHSSILPLLES
ncbi:hypothetical protein ACB092_06G098600 [Castanea dentata]